MFSNSQFPLGELVGQLVGNPKSCQLVGQLVVTVLSNSIKVRWAKVHSFT